MTGGITIGMSTLLYSSQLVDVVEDHVGEVVGDHGPGVRVVVAAPFQTPQWQKVVEFVIPKAKRLPSRDTSPYLNLSKVFDSVRRSTWKPVPLRSPRQRACCQAQRTASSPRL